MRVLRIEWPNGKGFYTGGNGNALMDHVNDSYTHPTPWNDSLYSDNLSEYARRAPHGWEERSMFFGFESSNQLRRWFYRDQWIHNMQAHCLRVQVYEVDDSLVIHGRAQVTFEKDKATLVRTLEPIDLMNGVVHFWEVCDANR